MSNWCAVCFKPDVSLRCGACQKAFYCTKEHQKMVIKFHLPSPPKKIAKLSLPSSCTFLSLLKFWFTHKHICGNALNSDAMIPQPPLTSEEHRWYSLKTAPYTAGELQLIPTSKYNDCYR